MPNRNKILAPLLLATVLGLGFGTVWAVVAGWGVGLIDQNVREGELRQDVTIRMDGVPVIRTYHSYSYRDSTDRTFEGEVLDDFMSTGNYGELNCAYLDGPPRTGGLFTGMDWYRRVRSFSDCGRPATYWYIVHDGKLDGSAYMVGYNSKSKFQIGYIGTEGFRPDMPPASERFPIDGRRMGSGSAVASNGSYYGTSEPYSVSYRSVAKGRIPHWMVYLVSQDRLLEIDLEKRSVRVLHECEGLMSANVLTEAVKADNEDDLKLAKPREYLAARSEDRIFLFDDQGNLDRTLSIPDRLRGRPFALFDIGDGRYISQSTDYGDGERTYELVWFDQEGTALDEDRATLHYKGFPQGNAAVTGVLGAVVPAPVVVDVAALVVRPIVEVFQGKAPDYPSALSSMLAQTWPVLAAINLVGFVCATICLRRQRRTGSGRTWIWVAFVFLFGLPGLVGYLFHRTWPAEESCPACGQEAPRDRDSCFACGAGFPEPEAKGIEVFA